MSNHSHPLSHHHRARLLEAYNEFHQLHSHRKQALFTEFLPHGHALMTLDSVPEHHRDDVILVKSLLGMHITLYDDLADNYALQNEQALKELYKIPFDNDLVRRTHLNTYQNKLVDLAINLTSTMHQKLSSFTHYPRLRSVFEFDLKQFYNANHYYELALKDPHILNTIEIQFFGPFNMGMIIAGTIDIMASPRFDFNDLAQSRAIFFFAQRFGHICNSITTLEREIHEQTYTNEAIILAKEQRHLSLSDLRSEHPDHILKQASKTLTILRDEQTSIVKTIAKLAHVICSWDAGLYAAHLIALHQLHEDFRGTI